MADRVSTNELRVERLRRRRRYPPFRLIRAYVYDVVTLLQEARIPLLGFCTLTAVNSFYLIFFFTSSPCAGTPCLSPLRALFETIRMYVFEINLDWPEQDRLGQVLFFVTPLLGVALLFQSVLDFGRFLLDKNSRREGWQLSLAKTFHDHIIVCGLGRVSYRVMLQLLDAGYDVVVIERDWNSEFVPTALKLKVPVVLGDAREPDMLRQAGLMRARSVVAGINDDLINIEIALAARHYRPDIQMVLRIFSDELDMNLERSFGPNAGFSSSALAAATLAAAAVSRDIIHVIPLPDQMMGISEITIAADSQLAGFVQAIEEQYNVRLLYHRDAQGRERRFDRRNRLERGDKVVLLGALEALDHARVSNQRSRVGFLHPPQLQRPSPQFNTVIVCGMGKVGYRVIKLLHRMSRCPEIVVICEEDTRSPLVHEIEALGIRVIRGDARNPELLRTAGIEHAYSVAAVTSDKLVNIQVGLTARRLHPDIHLVLRVFSDVMAEQLEELFGAHTVFSTSALAAPTLAAGAIVRGIGHTTEIGQRLYSTIALKVKREDAFVGKPISQVREQAEVLVMSLRRRGVPLLPLKLDTCLEVGDVIVVLVDIARLEELRSQQVQTGEATTRRLVATQTGRLDWSERPRDND